MGGALNKIHMYYIRFYILVCIVGRVLLVCLCVCGGGRGTYIWRVSLVGENEWDVFWEE